MIDVWYMILFGIVGYMFKKLDYNMAPMLLALVLGNLAESSMRQALIMSQGSVGIFFHPPIALPLAILAGLIGFWPLIQSVKARIMGPKKA